MISGVDMVIKKLFILFLMFNCGFNCLYAPDCQVYTFDRITQDAVNKRKNVIKDQQSKSNFTKTCVKAGAAALAIIGGVGITYALFKRDSLNVGAKELLNESEAAIKVTKEQLREEIKKLSERIESGPQLGSWAWWKACFVNIALSPTIAVIVFKALGSLSDAVAKKLFFAGNAGSFVEQATQLGILAARPDEHGCTQETLVRGLIVKELEHSAELLDRMSIKSGEEYEYHKKRININFNHVIADITGLIAFLYHMADEWSASKPLATEAHERAQYLMHIANKASNSLEQALSASSPKPVLSIIKEFFNELEQVLINVVRIENRYS